MCCACDCGVAPAPVTLIRDSEGHKDQHLLLAPLHGAGANARWQTDPHRRRPSAEKRKRRGSSPCRLRGPASDAPEAGVIVTMRASARPVTVEWHGSDAEMFRLRVRRHLTPMLALRVRITLVAVKSKVTCFTSRPRIRLRGLGLSRLAAPWERGVAVLRATTAAECVQGSRGNHAEIGRPTSQRRRGAPV